MIKLNVSFYHHEKLECIILGQVGGSDYNTRGGGVNYLCLPNDPENGQHQSYNNIQVYGSEYRLSSSVKPSGWYEYMANMEVPCSVCSKTRRSTVLMIPGQVGGTQYNYRGGGVNYLCLPNDPENGQHQSYDNNQVYGSEYQLSSSMKSSGWSESMADKEVPCAVCYQKHRSTVLMIPGRKTCYKGWIPEYNGYLMSDHNTHFRRDFACVDINAEPMDNKNGNEDGAVFYPLRTKCGSLRCPPYTNEADVLCVVCTK
ncbi:unnamed protein product [Mytilus edulis]|uniref:Short-chain collagen C4-like n=1 Tax=Mytilus edulis TaxID=6550 RepID=A0A8S3SW17_MYTED|nr:unnamed protein product [Mytilus edulis]